MKYRIAVYNAPGASESKAFDTQAECSEWLASWQAPEDLRVSVVDKNGNEVGSKRMGRKRIVWG